MRLPVLAEIYISASLGHVRLAFDEKSLHQTVASPSRYCDCVACPSFSHMHQVFIEWHVFCTPRGRCEEADGRAAYIFGAALQVTSLRFVVPL